VRDAILVLEDGRTFRGEAYGAVGTTVGEAVFATGMTGYQETLTDPSYAGQVVVMTAPHIGNTGVNDEDDESRRIWVSGFVVRDPARRPANWRATGTLDDALAKQGVVGISGIDTRALTRHLRERGAMRVGVSSDGLGPEELLARVQAAPAMVGADLAPRVTTSDPYVVPAVGETRYRIAALDLGIKTATPRHLAALGVETTVLPATATAEQLLEAGPDGVFLSNGPGDPAAADYAVQTVKGILEARPRPRARPGHLQAALRPPRAQPAGAGPRERHRSGDQPQPRLRRRRAARPADRHALRAGRGQPRRPQRRRRGRPAPDRGAGVQRAVPPRVRRGSARRGSAVPAVRRSDGGAAGCLSGQTSSTCW
jgi:hypothetical protein